REYYGDRVEIKKPLPRKDSSGISIGKAERMLGYSPRRSWSDYLDEEGKLKPGAGAGLFSPA
ncbi:MAG TPA: NAD(P)-dependent oxidoreductase, partial [Rubrobacteraceae bacterium]